MTPVLLTERLLLRPLEHEDAHVLAALLGIPAVADALCDVPLPFTPLHAAARILMVRAREMAGRDAAWAVEGGDGEVVGFVGLADASADSSANSGAGRPATMSFALHPAVRGAGLAGEALEAVVDWAGRTRFCEMVRCEVMPGAIASARTLARLGFVQGRDTLRYHLADGATRAVHVFRRSLDASPAQVARTAHVASP
jgi:RimJ/RimL family protein N-acetyltransferase